MAFNTSRLTKAVAGAIAVSLRSLFRGLKLPKFANGRLTLPAISLSVGSKHSQALRAESLPNFRILPGRLTHSVYLEYGCSCMKSSNLIG